MAIQTWIFSPYTASGSNFAALKTAVTGTPGDYYYTGTGWYLKTYQDRVAQMSAGVVRDAGWNGSDFTIYYDEPPSNTIANCFRSDTSIKGIFAAGTWNFIFQILAPAGASPYGNGYPFFSVWKGSAADGSNATQILTNRTHAAQTINTTNERTFTTSVSLSELNFNNEYIFIQIGWRITTPGSNNAYNCQIRYGPTGGSRVETSDFNPTQDVTVTGSGIDSLTEVPANISTSAGPVSITFNTINEIQAVADVDEDFTMSPGPVSASFEGMDIEPEFDTDFEASYNAREIVWLLDRYLI
jgi:hypothetical protein